MDDLDVALQEKSANSEIVYEAREFLSEKGTSWVYCRVTRHMHNINKPDMQPEIHFAISDEAGQLCGFHAYDSGFRPYNDDFAKLIKIAEVLNMALESVKKHDTLHPNPTSTQPQA